MNKQNTLPPDESKAGLLRNEEPSVTGEHIQMLPLNVFFPFANHPYQIRDDPEMAETLQSVSERGVLQPILARPRQQGGYWSEGREPNNKTPGASWPPAIAECSSNAAGRSQARPERMKLCQLHLPTIQPRSPNSLPFTGSPKHCSPIPPFHTSPQKQSCCMG